MSLFFVWVTPQGIDWLYLLLVGLFAQLGQIFLTDALQRERVAGVAIVNYTGLVYAIAIGWILFGEAQTLITAMGMALVVLGVVLSVIYGHHRERIEILNTTSG